MTLAALASLALVQLLLAMSPGPAFVLTLRTAAGEGIRAALWLTFGFAVAVMLWAAAALAGLSILFEIMPWLQTGLRIAGALFLIYVAVMLWRDAHDPLPEKQTDVPRGALRSFLLGLWTDLANPKALAFFAAIFSGLIPASPTLADAAAILAVVFVVECVWYAFVALVFSQPAPRRLYARIKAQLERIFAVMLGGFAVRIGLG
ncbi:MAG: LysE family transporter [Sulfitobacter sp.]